MRFEYRTLQEREKTLPPHFFRSIVRRRVPINYFVFSKTSDAFICSAPSIIYVQAHRAHLTRKRETIQNCCCCCCFFFFSVLLLLLLFLLSLSGNSKKSAIFLRLWSAHVDDRRLLDYKDLQRPPPSQQWLCCFLSSTCVSPPSFFLSFFLPSISSSHHFTFSKRSKLKKFKLLKTNFLSSP